MKHDTNDFQKVASFYNNNNQMPSPGDSEQEDFSPSGKKNEGSEYVPTD